MSRGPWGHNDLRNLWSGKIWLMMAIAYVLASGLFPRIASTAEAVEARDNGVAGADEFKRVSEILVTARRRSERLETLPMAVTSLRSADFKIVDARSLADLVSLVPNMSLGGGLGTSLQGEFGLRGYVTTVRTIGVEAGIGVYVDDVLQGRPEAFDVNLTDVAAVDVLRGPQGTLFGRNTVAGAILITTKPAGPGSSARAEVQGGNYNFFRFDGTANQEIMTDRIFSRLSVSYARRAGFYYNNYDNTRLETLNVGSARGTLRAVVTDKLEVIFRADATVDRSIPVFFKTAYGSNVDQVLPPYSSNRNRKNDLDKDVYGFSLHSTYDFGNGTKLIWIGALRRSIYDAALDDDSTSVDQFYSRWRDDNSYVSNELRLLGNVGDRLNWVVGTYYFWQNAKTYRPNLTGTDFIFPSAANQLLEQQGRVTTNSYAGYFHADLQLTDWISLAGGLRYTYERKYGQYRQDGLGIFPDINTQGHIGDHAISPMATLSIKPWSNVLTYATVSRGFKSGGFNTDFVTNPDISFMPEHATNYEIGTKVTGFEGKVALNAAAFHVDYRNLQVSQIVFASVQLTNAGRAKADGAEVELVVAPNERLGIRTSVGYLNARYTHFPDCLQGMSGLIDCSGNPLKNAPKWSGVVATTYRIPTTWGGDLVLRGDVSYKDKVTFDVASRPELSEGSYAVADARIDFEARDWRIGLWGKNLTGTLYATNRDERSAFGQFNVYYAAPRTFGITASKIF